MFDILDNLQKKKQKKKIKNNNFIQKFLHHTIMDSK